MATHKKKYKSTKQRHSTYEPKVKFEGTFEDMIKVSTIGAGAKPKRKDSVSSDVLLDTKDKNTTNK